MIYFKIVLHKAFINVNRKHPTEKPQSPRQIRRGLPQPTHRINSHLLRPPLSFQPQISSHHLRRRLRHSYLYPYPGMVKYMNASLSVYIYSLILLDRAQEYNPEFIIHKRNIHRLLLVSNLVAAKYIDDLYYKNSYYATVGGVSLKVLN